MNRYLIGMMWIGLSLGSPLTAQQAETPPASPWTGSISAGLALTEGNTVTRNFNAGVNLVWDPKTVHLFKADVVYLKGSRDGEDTLDRAAANFRYERTIDRRIFGFTELGYLRDRFKEIDILLYPLVGAGYHFLDTESKKLSGTAAVGAAYEKNLGMKSTTSGSLQAGEDFRWKLSEGSNLIQKLTGLWKTDDFSDALYQLEVSIAASITRRSEMKFSYLVDYKNKPPAPGIRKRDGALIAAWAFKF